MAVREVLRFPHPALKQRARELGENDGAEAARVAADLVETMRSYERCTGIAAPQIGERALELVAVRAGGHGDFDQQHVELLAELRLEVGDVHLALGQRGGDRVDDSRVVGPVDGEDVRRLGGRSGSLDRRHEQRLEPQAAAGGMEVGLERGGIDGLGRRDDDHQGEVAAQDGGLRVLDVHSVAQQHRGQLGDDAGAVAAHPTECEAAGAHRAQAIPRRVSSPPCDSQT